MSCEDLRIKERLPEFFSGDLPPEEEKEIRHHLAHCAECREELDLVGLFAGDRDVEPPPGFRVSLPKEGLAVGNGGRRRFWRPLAPVLAGGLAAAVLVLLFPGPWKSAPPVVEDGLLARYLFQRAERYAMGLEEEILSVSGFESLEVDRALGEEMAMAGEAETFVNLADGFSAELLDGMDEETMVIFEGFLDEMAPEGAERG